jgi:hypothetical protein
MRRVGPGLLVLLGAGLFLADARAQTGNFATGQQAGRFLTGANRQNLTFTKIDTSRALKAPTMSSAFRPPPQPKAPAGLGTVFPKISLGSWPPKLPSVGILQGKNPFQPNPPPGTTPFNRPKKK